LTSKSPITIANAARELGVDDQTVRRWIRKDGAPCAALGGPGRGRGALVNVEDLKRWRAARAGIDVGSAAAPDFAAIVARGLMRAFRRGTQGETDPTWARLADKRSRAAIILGDAYLSIIFEMTGREPAEWSSIPAEIKTLITERF
jgi:transposase-like protein